MGLHAVLQAPSERQAATTPCRRVPFPAMKSPSIGRCGAMSYPSPSGPRFNSRGAAKPLWEQTPEACPYPVKGSRSLPGLQRLRQLCRSSAALAQLLGERRACQFATRAAAPCRAACVAWEVGSRASGLGALDAAPGGARPPQAGASSTRLQDQPAPRPAPLQRRRSRSPPLCRQSRCPAASHPPTAPRNGC